MASQPGNAASRAIRNGGVRNKADWYSLCAFANPLNSTTLQNNPTQHGNGTFSCYAPNIYALSEQLLDGSLCAPGNSGKTGVQTPYVNATQGALLSTGGVANQLSGLGLWRFNTSLFKTSTTRRQQNLRFGVDCFNVFNHPSLSNPSSSGDNGGNTGQITEPAALQPNTINARYFQLSAKHIF
jgi:hypothetical protein